MFPSNANFEKSTTSSVTSVQQHEKVQDRSVMMTKEKIWKRLQADEDNEWRKIKLNFWGSKNFLRLGYFFF